MYYPSTYFEKCEATSNFGGDFENSEKEILQAIIVGKV